MTGPMVGHGSYGRYHDGCRCDECRSFMALKRREQRARTGDPYGRARRLAMQEAAWRFRREHPRAWKKLLQQHLDQAHEGLSSPEGLTD